MCFPERPAAAMLAAMRARLILILLLVAALVAGGFFFWQSRRPPARGAAAYEHTKAILALGPRPPGSPGLTAVRAYLKGRLEQAGWNVQSQPFERSTSIGQVKFENLRARFGGGNPWQQPPTGLLCAHMDSKLFKDKVFLGADDAASACGAILEIAAVMARETPDLAGKLELVFFDGEEAFGEGITSFDGLYGSRYYASQWRTQPAKPAFGILLDMVGHKDLKIELPLDTPEPLLKAILAAAKAEGAADHFATAPGPITDDHVPLNLAGIPTADVIGRFAIGVGSNGQGIYAPWWHTTGDSLELISQESLDISIRVTLNVLRGQLQGGAK